MVKYSQAASPVTSPRISAPGQVFNQVRSSVYDGLRHTSFSPNRMAQVIAQGPAPQPRAIVSNDLAATVAAYEPLPGRQMARQMHLEIQNTPPPKVDQVIDAIQRYLNLQPRREPTADPKDEASIVRHPQQIIQSAQRWEEAMRYQLVSNGVELQQNQPEYRGWGGGLQLQLNNPGPTGVSAPATLSPWPGRPPQPNYVVHDPAQAAQESISQMQELFTKAEPPEIPGPPIWTENPYFEPSLAGQNAIRATGQRLAEAPGGPVTVGSGNYTANPANAPAEAWKTAINKIPDLENSVASTYLKSGGGSPTGLLGGAWNERA